MVNKNILDWSGSLITVKFLDKHHNCPDCFGHTVGTTLPSGLTLHPNRVDLTPRQGGPNAPRGWTCILDWLNCLIHSNYVFKFPYICCPS